MRVCQWTEVFGKQTLVSYNGRNRSTMNIRANVWNLRRLSENMLKFAETEEDKMGNKNQEGKRVP